MNPMDSPAPVPVPDAPAKRKLPFEPWMIAAAVGLGAGVIVGLRVSQLFKPPQLPTRSPCPECEQRRLAGPGGGGQSVTVTKPPAPPVIVPDEIVREFSAQALPTDAEPIAMAPTESPLDPDELPDG